MFSMFMPHVNAQETVIFQDDFESYAVGTFPSSGGWKLVYNGAGDQYQVITSDYAACGTKSLQMEGQYGWSAVVAKDFSSISNLIGFEAYLMGTSGSWPSVGFGNETIQPWGRLYGAVGVDTIDGYIVAGSQNLQSCTANTWYKIREVMDRNARTFDVWIDDQLKGTNIPEANNPWEIQSLRFDVGWHQVMNYYDDVKVFEVSGPPAGTPVISSVSTITATRLQSIHIYGSGFGNTPPQTVSLGDGSVDTVESSTTPYMWIADSGKLQKTGDPSDGGENWAAGFKGSGVFCMIGIYLVSWSDNEIVLDGFGTALGTNGQGTWYIEPGDPLTVAVYTQSGNATYHTTVAGSLRVSPNLQKVVPGGGTSFAVSLDSPTISSSLSFSTSASGVNGYFVPETIGGATGLLTSSLFISTSIFTSCGVHTVVVTATPNSDDPVLTPISTQVALEVMGGVTIAVMDACSDNKPIIGAKVVVGSLSRVTGASGILTFPSLGTGYYDVTISAKGYSGDVFTNKECPRVYKNQYLEVGKTFTGYLFPLRYTLTINVHDQYRNPVDGASGDIYDSNGHIYGAFATPPWGYLTMQNLEAATGLTMIIQKYGYETKTLTFDITSDVTLNIVLNDLGVATTRLTVHVEHVSTGVAISGATVQVAGQTGTTDRIGNAYFSALQFKEYIVTVSKAGYATAYSRITISRTSPTPTIKVNLTPEVFGLFVHIQDSFGAPISGATVTIPKIPGKFTDTGGDAVFTGISSGTYIITASKAGYISSSTVASLVSSNVWVTITLQFVAMPDFSISVSPTSQAIKAGSSASFTITIKSINGFNQLIELSLGGAVLPQATVTFSPSAVTPPPGGTIQAILTISTTSAFTPGDYQLQVTGWYAGSLGSIVHSYPIMFTVHGFEYNLEISHESSSGNDECYLFQTATFTVKVFDASNRQYIDPDSYAVFYDGHTCTSEVIRVSKGVFTYATSEFKPNDLGLHDFIFQCWAPGGAFFATSDTVTVKLHKNNIKLVFSTTEQFFPVDGLFYDGDNDVSNNFANYSVGTRPSALNAYYYLAQETSAYYVVEYWVYYAYNKYWFVENAAGFYVPDNHEHDFESIYVWVDKNTHCISKLILSQHMWTNKYDSNIPLELYIAVEEGGHGMIMAHPEGALYVFDKPANALSIPPFKGYFASTDPGSAVILLNAAYCYTQGASVNGFGDSSLFYMWLNYDAIMPFVGDITFFSTKPFFPWGLFFGGFYAVYVDKEVTRSDLLQSSAPFSPEIIIPGNIHIPIGINLMFYIRAPWTRGEFSDPSMQDAKGGYYPFQVKDLLNGWINNIVRILNGLSILPPTITIAVDPIYVSIVDSQGRVLGDKDGTFVSEIPGGEALSSDYLIISNATDDYTIELSSNWTGKYTVKFSMLYSNTTVDFEAIDIPVERGSVHAYTIDWNALANGGSGTTILVDQFGTGAHQILHVGSELTGKQFSSMIGLSNLLPKTTLSLTEPKLILENFAYITSSTQFILSPISERCYQQGDGALTSVTSTDIAGTFYRIFNEVYDSGWLNYTEPFCLYGLGEGTYTIEYYSIDKLGNNETVNTIRVILQGAPLPTPYSLTITATLGGTTDPTPGTYTYTANQTAQITAIPDTGYSLDHWELDSVNVGSANPYTVLMDANHTLRAVFLPVAPPLSTSISPLSDSILVGQSVTFTSTVSGGYTPYSYQWYLNGAPVSGATSNTWTFTLITSGIYYVHLKVTDAKGNTAQSDAARITAATVPVGGYSFPIQVQTKAEPIIPYIALIATLTAIFTKLRPKNKRKH
jgi:hypothetical protein